MNEIQEFINRADEKLTEIADGWATNKDAKFASGVRTGIRLSRTYIRDIYEKEYRRENDDKIR